MKCKYCGKKVAILEETVFTDNHDLCCGDCAEQKPMCATCGRIITGHDNYEEETGNHYCDQCF